MEKIPIKFKVAKVKMRKEHLSVSESALPSSGSFVAAYFHKRHDVGEEQEKVKLKSHSARLIISGFETLLIYCSPPKCLDGLVKFFGPFKEWKNWRMQMEVYS